ncbi:MAG: aspartate-semialdehyde dehydrogenase [Thermodesulfobacteriota bacterium]
MKKDRYNIAVVGATGVVGKEMLKIIEERAFPVNSTRLLASERSAGSRIEFKGRKEVVHLLSEETFENIDIGLFSPGASISAVYAPRAASASCVVIDNTSCFRMDEDVPLIVPEVNPHCIKDYKQKGIIANPNCSTIQMVVALKPIHDVAKIKRVVVSTYQATSGAGRDAMDELFEQTRAILNHKKMENKVFPHKIAFNCIPQIDVFLNNRYTKEEMKMAMETRKIMGDDSIRINATTVRVPVFIGHSESVNIETEKKLTVEDTIKILSSAPGIRVVDDPSNCIYPMPVDASEEDDILVGRIREDESIPKGINMWIVADNLRKGAALNAVQIAEILIKDHL